MVPNSENAQIRASGLRPPSRIPATTGLLEMSASDNNARAIPPPANLLKHKGSALPEPAPKRKTLAERAGEPPARSTNTTSRVMKRSNTTNALRKTSGNHTTSSVRPASAAATHRTNSALPRTGSRSALAARPTSIAQEDDDEDLSSSSILPNKRKAWDTKGRLEDMETLYSQLKSQLDSAATEKSGMEEGISIYKARISEMEQIRLQLSTANQTLTTELAETKVKLSSVNTQLDDMKRSHSFEIDDLRRKNRNDIEDAKDDHRKELERLQREARDELDRVR
ncbi:kinesin-like protein klpA, partial [Aureobasidium melanogenum]